MKIIRSMVLLACAAAWMSASAVAADKQAKKLTCCEEAKAAGKDCTHKCCLAAHKDGKSCEKCNPGKEDLKLLKKQPKAAEKK